MIIRLMKDDDFSDVYEMWKQAKLSLDTYENEKREFENMIEINPDSCFVAVNEGKVIGSIFGTSNGRRAFIFHLAVHAEWQGKGIGKKLLTSVEIPLKKKHLKKLYVMVDSDNLQAIPFYEKCDYTMYTGSILMRKIL